GKLNILAAGDSGRLKQAQPLFDALGQKTWHFGADPAQANVVKIATNFTLASAIEAMAEGSALVRNYGVSGADYLQMLSSTVFAAPAYQGYGALIAAEKYSPAGFRLALGLKDVGLALAAGAALVLNWVLLFSAYRLASISLATAVYNVQPFFLIGLGALFLGE
ncbi:NAD-binding protein, partial [Escherichia coli]|uniref:NAD-binding protein n=1 Tax=Escherichia coli TaxID=562 RepID=UPI002283E518